MKNGQNRLRRLEQLIERYRLAQSVQLALLNLSELAGTLSDMNEFYPAIHSLVNKHLAADNFYVVLYDAQYNHFSVEYYADEKDPIEGSGFASEVFLHGLTGYVARTKKALLCDEQMFADLLAKGEIEVQGTLSHHWLGVPLTRGDQLIGVMVAQLYDNSRDYSQKDLELLRAIAMHTVVALDRVKSRELLEQTVRERTKQLQNTNQSLQREIRERVNAEKLQAALYEISELTSNNSDTASFYRQVHRILCSLMPAENCYIALLDDSGKKLSFPFYVDQFSPPPQERTLRKGFTEYVTCW
jgi:GAF domain-containing protein